MRRRLVGLLGALLLACAGLALPLLLAAPASAACTCQPGTLDQNIQRADAVFTGTLDSVRPNADDTELEYAISASRVYQGTVEAQTVVTSPSGANACGLGALDAGAEYLWFVGAAGEGMRSTLCDGTGPSSVERVSKVEEILGTGQSVVPEPPEQATRTRVAEGDPARFSRLAAPGGALVIVGLLGLAVVGRLSRR